MNIPSIAAENISHAFSSLMPSELLDRLVQEQDRAPIGLIDACVAQGDGMVAMLQDLVDGELAWDGDSRGEWWLLLHAAFILGRMPSEAAGILLVRLMRAMDEHGDENLQDWVAGYWPALLANKPRRVIEVARELAEDRTCDGYIRAQALDVVLDAALRESESALDAAIDWEARFVIDPSEDWWFRTMAGLALLGFPRERHRAALQAIADGEAAKSEERGFVDAFTTRDIEDAFSAGHDDPDWQRFSDPWKFYTPEAIAARQERWSEEDTEDDTDDPDWDVPEPYVRVTRKIGRNDPCPCGSGKKYKRCCLAHDEAVERAAASQT